MKSYWQEFWVNVRTRSKYALWALPLSLIPFFFNLPHLWENGLILSGLLYSLGFGSLIGGVVWATYMVFYSTLGWLQFQFGYVLQQKWWIDVSIGLCGTVLGILFTQYVRKIFWQESIDGAGFFASLALGLLCLTVFLLYSQYQQARAEALQHQAALADARYHVLENQMHPHFLFNALNSLAELIESGQGKAAEVALTLSDLYRNILANSKTKTASLESELAITRAYLALEKLRFGERLQFSILAPDDAAKIYLPSLALQTLVENAIKHGIAKSIEGGSVEISVQKSSLQWYQLRIINSGAAFNPTPDSAGKTGVVNTQERLQLLYGNQHEFQIRADEAGRTCGQFYFSGEKID
jgi:two-component system, LytTR family, sensor kinase